MVLSDSSAAPGGKTATLVVMTGYLGSSPYCYANALCMSAGAGWSPSLVETLTGSAFGVQMLGPVALFDPVGWDPDAGVDQALELLGWTGERETFDDAAAAMARLGELCRSGPVFVGPLEMGLLSHRPGCDRPIGADHFVTVLSCEGGAVMMHDPQGHPYARLPQAEFASAWGSETLGYGQGRFPLRAGLRPLTPHSAEEALAALISRAHRWADASNDGEEGNAAALRALAAQCRTGAEQATLSVLATFSLRLGARRRADAALALAAWPDVAGVLDRQARVLGGAQLPAVRSDGGALADAFETMADLHAALVTALARTA